RRRRALPHHVRDPARAAVRAVRDPGGRAGLMATNRAMVRSYADDLRLFPTWTKRAALVGLVALYLFLPLLVDNLWANVLALCGITAVGALSLTLLTGYTGQPSLGHAAFIGLGAFTAGFLGGGRLLGTPPHGYDLNLWVYLAVAIVLGGAVGFVIGLP